MEELELAGLEKKKLSGYTRVESDLGGAAVEEKQACVWLQWARKPSRQHCPNVDWGVGFLSLGVSGMGSVATWEEGHGNV